MKWLLLIGWLFLLGANYVITESIGWLCFHGFVFVIFFALGRLYAARR